MSSDPTALRTTAGGSDALGGRTYGRTRTAAQLAVGTSGANGATPAKGGRQTRRQRKVRRVHRVVQHVEVWSVAKLAGVFVACGYVVTLISGYLLWQAAERVGTIDGIEGFFEDAGGYDSYELVGSVVFRISAVAGLVLAATIVFLLVLGGVIFNLVSDLTGGIRMTVIDEDLIVTPARPPRPAASSPSGPAPGPTPVPDRPIEHPPADPSAW